MPGGAAAADAGASSASSRSAGAAAAACTAGMVPLAAALAGPGAACSCPSEAAMFGFTLNSDSFLGPLSSSVFACIATSLLLSAGGLTVSCVELVCDSTPDTQCTMGPRHCAGQSLCLICHCLHAARGQQLSELSICVLLACVGEEQFTSEAAARPCFSTGTLAGGMAPLSLDGSSSSTAPSFFSLSMRSLVASLGSCTDPNVQA